VPKTLGKKAPQVCCDMIRDIIASLEANPEWRLEVTDESGELIICPVIPSDGHATPSRSDYCALIGRRGSPANAVAYFEKSGLVAGHGGEG
jgi:hypothetical protein